MTARCEIKCGKASDVKEWQILMEERVYAPQHMTDADMRYRLLTGQDHPWRHELFLVVCKPAASF
jgi:hypothetical protein